MQVMQLCAFRLDGFTAHIYGDRPYCTFDTKHAHASTRICCPTYRSSRSLVYGETKSWGDLNLRSSPRRLTSTLRHLAEISAPRSSGCEPLSSLRLHEQKSASA